ncbi:MAG: hypothetical protein ACK47B_26835 [Armatimonadota bacterium]
MADRNWVYDGPASTGDADGQTCIFCGKLICDESQPGRWVVKAEEDYHDADFPTDLGYSHHACTQERQASGRQSRFTLPDVPDIPRRS